ncbi:50S ribosomal protein L29 [Helicobacter valdiviensis]|uniref:Large ribosomal subunit protein uL29 n=1 Tax=Helicobacter valdiviensis TaxID=1458358 RepID=A0A2W6MUV9_9HELI|nr:50S ribosomal protein L29 [Helicobacter valdiviensis]PZT48315.1 50S ribosomal protein L29 [Helicobacter valdiviensis]
MKFTEINTKSLEELKTLLKEKETSLFELRLKLKTMQLTNSSEVRATKKDIARIKTALNALQRRA